MAVNGSDSESSAMNHARFARVLNLNKSVILSAAVVSRTGAIAKSKDPYSSALSAAQRGVPTIEWHSHSYFRFFPLGHRATTVVEIPPRGRKSPFTSAHTGLAHFTISSRTRLTMFS